MKLALFDDGVRDLKNLPEYYSACACTLENILETKRKAQKILDFQVEIQSKAAHLVARSCFLRSQRQKVEFNVEGFDQEFDFDTAICSNIGLDLPIVWFRDNMVLHYPKWSGCPVYPVAGERHSYERDKDNCTLWTNPDRWNYLHWLVDVGFDIAIDALDPIKFTTKGDK